MSENPYIEYNSSNINYARENRKKQTNAEEKMREFILKKKQTGYKFTRQKPLGPFIADFYCSKLLLVIELDGNSHNDKYIEDTQRTDIINDLGIIVIRYTNDEILNNIEGVKRDLEQKIKAREQHIQKIINRQFIYIKKYLKMPQSEQQLYRLF